MAARQGEKAMNLDENGVGVDNDDAFRPLERQAVSRLPRIHLNVFGLRKLHFFT